MSELYRFKFRSDFFEIELESTDSGFIDEKMMQLIELSMRSLEDAPKLLTSGFVSTAKKKAPPAEEPVPEEAPMEEEEAEEAPQPVTKKRRRRARRKKKKATPAPKAPRGSEVDPNAVAEQVKASDQYKTIRDNILGKSNQLNRILVSFYFAEQVYGRKGLTTGDVEAITEALKAGIKSTNISSQLKKYDQFFNSRGERKRGSVVHYKLNKDGRQKMESLLESA
jgi:outer membrane biosynthesis protein TonB